MALKTPFSCGQPFGLKSHVCHGAQADGDVLAAREGLEAALAVDGAHAAAGVALGRLLRQQGASQDLALAAAHLAGALRVRPDCAEAWCSPCGDVLQSALLDKACDQKSCWRSWSCVSLPCQRMFHGVCRGDGLG